jgi:hypothetical protein
VKRFAVVLGLGLVGLSVAGRREDAAPRAPVDLVTLSVTREMDPCFRAHAYIDRSNATGCADDRNDCGTAECGAGRHGPCRTFAEWSRRCPGWADDSFACVTIVHTPVHGTYFDNGYRDVTFCGMLEGSDADRPAAGTAGQEAPYL